MTLDEAIEIIQIGAGPEEKGGLRFPRGYRTYPGTGGMWCGSNDGIADAQFDDWGLAQAAATILNAVLQGQLIKTPLRAVSPVTLSEREQGDPYAD